MLNTLNYSETLRAYMSFVSSKPMWYLDFSNKYYSFDQDNTLWKHNSSSAGYNELSVRPVATGDITTHTYDNSFMSFIVNDVYPKTKTFDNVNFTGNNIDNISVEITFNTISQDSTQITFDDILKREDTYRFAIPREEHMDTFAPRMRGKYLKSNYKFITNGQMFSLPFIETTYRYSSI
jgi:hypothetical protein